MKSSLRAALALGALALASAQASASPIYINNQTVFLNPGSDGLLSSSTGHDAPASTFFLNSASANFVTFTLRDTDDENYKIDYKLSGGDIVGAVAWTLQDNIPGAFSYLLSAGQTYTLKIDTDADVSSSTVFTSAVPLPAAAWLFGSAVLGFGALRRKQKAGANAETAAV